MSHAVEVLLHVHGPLAYLLVFALPALESSAFTGFVFPGELAVLLGGVLAFQGRVSLPGIGAAACGGAIVGDCIGYAIGRRVGPALFSTRLVSRLVRPERRRSAEELLRRRGATAVLLGRFTAVLRVLMPGLAGMAHLRYRRFLAACVGGGVVWAGAFTLLGYAAGDAWGGVEHVAARASLLLGSLVVLAVAIALAARRLAASEARIRAWWGRVCARPRVAGFSRRYATQIGFLYRRLDPREALGLYLTMGIALSLAAGWVFGAAAGDIASGEQVLAGDASIVHSIAMHRSAAVTRIVRDLAVLGQPAAVVALVAAGALLAGRVGRSVRPAAFVLVAVVGGELLSQVVGVLVGRPAMTGGVIRGSAYSFPSGHTVVVASLLGAVALAVSAGRVPWQVRVWAWAGSLLAVVVVGLSVLYLGIAHVSDVLGGACLAAAWLAVSGTGWRTWERVTRLRAARGAQAGNGPV